eukprot:gene31496-40555_t
MGVAFCVVIACGFLVVPVMTRIIFTGDKEAAAEVIDEMFDAKNANDKRERASEKGVNLNSNVVRDSQIMVNTNDP